MKLTIEKKEIIANAKVMLRTVCATDDLKEEKGRQGVLLLIFIVPAKF